MHSRRTPGCREGDTKVFGGLGYRRRCRLMQTLSDQSRHGWAETLNTARSIRTVTGGDPEHLGDNDRAARVLLVQHPREQGE